MERGIRGPKGKFKSRRDRQGEGRCGALRYEAVLRGTELLDGRILGSCFVPGVDVGGLSVKRSVLAS